MTLPKAAVERIIRNAGAERVSEEAVEELREAIVDLGEEIASDSAEYADYADRNTVTEDDIEMAVNH
jgi:histone H3/H4